MNVSPLALGLVSFALAGVACAATFAAAFLADNRHLVPDLSWVSALVGELGFWLSSLRPEPATVAPVAVAAALPAVYFCAASGRWRDRATKRFAKAPAA